MNKMILIGLAALTLGGILFFTARDESPPPVIENVKKEAADGYLFEGKEFEHTDVHLRVVVVPDQETFNTLRNNLAPGATGLEAFSSINPTTNNCTVYIKDPTWEYLPEFIGHEIAHCVWGRWHNNRDKQETFNKI